jgi:hypothetical protein
MRRLGIASEVRPLAIYVTSDAAIAPNQSADRTQAEGGMPGPYSRMVICRRAKQPRPHAPFFCVESARRTDGARPGANLTGTANLVAELAPKRLQLLRELLPNAARLGSWPHIKRRSYWRRPGATSRRFFGCPTLAEPAVCSPTESTI